VELLDGEGSSGCKAGGDGRGVGRVGITGDAAPESSPPASGEFD